MPTELDLKLERLERLLKEADARADEYAKQIDEIHRLVQRLSAPPWTKLWWWLMGR